MATLESWSNDYLQFWIIIYLSLKLLQSSWLLDILLLAVKQDIRCWIAGIISSCIYLFLMFQANLYMESMLQIFYILMGFYGWIQWNIKAEDDKSLLITTWTFKKHFLVVSSILGFSLLFGMFLELTRKPLFHSWFSYNFRSACSDIYGWQKNPRELGYIGFLSMLFQWCSFSIESFI